MLVYAEVGGLKRLFDGRHKMIHGIMPIFIYRSPDAKKRAHDTYNGRDAVSA